MKHLVAVTVFTLIANLALAGNKGEATPPGDGAFRAHFQQQHEENVAFRKTLKDMPKEERLEAIKEQMETQHQENLEFFAAQHAQRTERVRSNERLTEAQKDELISFLDVQYQARREFFTRLHKERLAFVEELAGKDMTPEERQAAVKAQWESKKGEVKAFLEKQRDEFRAKMKEMIGAKR